MSMCVAAEWGAAPDTADCNGCTALFYAVTLGQGECSALLCEAGAGLNWRDRKGRTPAHCAATRGELASLQLLADRGADLWLPNVKGDLPLHESIQGSFTNIIGMK